MAYPAKDYVGSFMMHRGALLDLLDKLPDDKGDFVPWEGARSLSALLDHMADASEGMTSTAAGKAFAPATPSANLAQAKERVRSSTQNVRDMLTNMNAEQLETPVTFIRYEMPACKLIDFMREHEAHHKGQLWLMSRLIGVEPPLLVKFG